MSEPMPEQFETPPPADIVAKAGTYYRNARYIICALALGLGLYFAYDGWIGYPNEQAKFDRMTDKEQSVAYRPHTATDIRIQKRLSVGLIPLAFIALAFFLYRSRGEYRLSGTTLYVPGHPPVPFDAIVGIDKSNWERKGIVHIDYQLDDASPTARLTLDDFIYDQFPTDKIIDALTAWLKAEGVIEDSSEDEPEVEQPETP